MRSVCLLAICLMTAPPAARVQQPAETHTAAEKPYVLHVYANLIQLPTLVLNDDLSPVPPVSKEKFEISIDSGPPFHPTSMRREGNDPVSLGILLDVSGDEDELIQTLIESLPTLAPKYLHPQDHVSVFALDCKLMRSLDDEPVDPAALKRGLQAVVQAPGLHGAKKHGACGRTLMLRDALVRIMHSLGEMPGRRVLLAVADGHDGGSSVAWADAQQYASSQGVAVFGIRDALSSTGTQPSGLSDRRGAPLLVAGPSDEDLFRAMCESNGGLVMPSTRYELYKSLVQLVTDLRDRYIVEFPRPEGSQPGVHDIRVTVARSRYFVRSTGVSVSLPDPELANDPNTVPVSKSPATYGTRKPLAPKQ
jgi:VWFA-related protein